MARCSCCGHDPAELRDQFFAMVGERARLYRLKAGWPVAEGIQIDPTNKSHAWMVGYSFGSFVCQVAWFWWWAEHGSKRKRYSKGARSRNRISARSA